MRNIFIIASVLIALAVTIIFIVPAQTQVVDVGDTTLPINNFGNSGPVMTTPLGQNGMLEIPTKDGKVIINDVRAAADTLDVGGDMYALGGIDEDGTADYTMVYNHFDGSFSVAIYTQPYGVYRDQMTEDLRSRLGVTSTELCELSVYVGVPFEIHEEISGINLGLSGCENSYDI